MGSLRTLNFKKIGQTVTELLRFEVGQKSVRFFLTHPVDVSEMNFEDEIQSVASEGQLLQVNVNDQ